MAKLTFIGAAKSTTGSKHLLSWQGSRHTRRLLVDCGMYQGTKELRLKNRQEFPIAPELIDAIVLTHGHLDHVGWLPRLVQGGFDGPIYATKATLDVAELILHDSAHIQEEDARHARKWGYSKHKNPEPLYTEKDVERTLELFQPLDYYKSYELVEGLTVRLSHSGHILGSAFIEAIVQEGNDTIRVVFSGDVGRYNQPILQDPEPPIGADYFLLEGTYGNRVHDKADPKTEIAEVVNRTIERGGTVVIPAFAVGRSQQLIYYLVELMDEKRIPRIDIFLDSPMAVRITRKTRRHQEELDLQTLLGVREGRIFDRPEVHLLEDREQSKTLNEREAPCVIISASGMATAGRILHHLKIRLPKAENSVLLVGYQGEGTRGRRLLNGEKEIKIHGGMVQVRAEIVNMSSLSAHADYTEMLPWLRRMVPPAITFLVHGEEENLVAWGNRLEDELGWNIQIPNMNDTVELFPVDPHSRTLAKEGPAIPVRPVAVAVAGDVPMLQPAGFIAEEIYKLEPNEELAKRILVETDAADIILFPSAANETDSFITTLEDAGRRIWRIQAEHATTD